MDKNLAGLIGAVASLTATVPSHAATRAPVTAETLMQVNAYADLLRPIPNALALLKASNAAQARVAESGVSQDEATIQDAQFFYDGQPYYQRPYYPPQYYPPSYYRRPYYHHHHHHHHHHHQFRR